MGTYGHIQADAIRAVVPVTITTVLGIDPSKSATGLAVWRSDGYVCLTTLETDTGVADEQRWHQIATRIWSHIIPDGHTYAVMEGAIDVKGRGNTTQALGELRGVLRYGLWLRGVPYIQPRPTTVKKYAGNGGWGKETMLVAARSQLATPVQYARTFDEADALWCLALGMHAAGRPLVDPTQRRVETIMSLDWPMVWPSKLEGDTPR